MTQTVPQILQTSRSWRSIAMGDQSVGFWLTVQCGVTHVQTHINQRVLSLVAEVCHVCCILEHVENSVI